jgi:DMSO/TMAO reductase YedYZ molybdopterin-dependent catalytic subunit
MSSTNTKLIGVVLVVILLAGGIMAALVLFQPQTTEPEEPQVLVIGSDGTKLNVTLSDMLEMSAITRNGSYQNSYGNIRGYGLYTGVNISALIDLVGGMTENDTVKITALDGYSQTFEMGKVYPNQSVWDIQGDMVLAYEYNNTKVPDYEEGFRVAFLPLDGLYSNADANATTNPNPSGAGPQWVSNVMKIQVIPPEPEIIVLSYQDSSLSFTMTELKELPSVNGEGGYRKSTGTISGPFNITGVAFSTLLGLLPALPSNYTLTSLSDDNRETNYTKAMVEGSLSGYTPTGDPLESIQSTMILAYEIDGNPIPVGDGPLRITFINEDGNLTDGSLWAKYVVSITVLDVPPVTFLLRETSNPSLVLFVQEILTIETKCV